ncbi:MAG: HD domain-containing protein [bacterium]
MSLKRDVELLFEAGTLRFVDRMWKQLFGPELQNDAEHAFRVIWSALILAKMEQLSGRNRKQNIDTGKLIKMALVHDLVESRTGDTHYLSRRYTKRDDMLAIKDIFKSTSLDKEFVEIFKEYEERKTLEAKIVKDADNLDIDIETREVEYRGGKIPRMWRKFRTTARADFYTKSAKKLAQAVVKADPNDWHQLGRNRFTTGDWKK